MAEINVKSIGLGSRSVKKRFWVISDVRNKTGNNKSVDKKMKNENGTQRIKKKFSCNRNSRVER